MQQGSTDSVAFGEVKTVPLKVPVLILTGTSDMITGSHMSEQLFHSIESDAPYQLVLFRGMGHGGFESTEEGLEILQEFVRNPSNADTKRAEIKETKKWK